MTNLQEAKTLVRIIHGSHLYGTSTPTSDEDYKSVHIPSGAAILMGRQDKVIDRKIKLSDGPKNEHGDVDDQSFPFHKFIQMVTSGDTVGTEILFAPQSAIIEQAPEWELIQAMRPVLINKQCKGFVGYCQRQAAKYGIKGSRMAACKGIVELLAVYMNEAASFKLEMIAPALEEFVATHEFSDITTIEQASGIMLPHLDVVDRKVPYTNTVKQAFDTYSKVYENYGHRTRAAMNNEGVDWKAVSHAVRVARQAAELLRTGHITFPRPDAEELLAIKQGKIDYNLVAPMLEGLVEEVDIASKESHLPGKTDSDLIEGLITAHYHAQMS